MFDIVQMTAAKKFALLGLVSSQAW